MDNQALAHHMRRHRRFAIPLHLDTGADGLAKRLTPEQLASIQAEMSASMNRASSTAAVGAAAYRPTPSTSSRAAAVTATLSSSVRSTASTSASVTQMVGQPQSNIPTSSSTTTVQSSSSVAPSSSSITTARALPSSSSAVPSSSTTTSPASTLPQVITRTLASSTTSSESALPSASVAASTSSSSSSPLSTGAVVGIVLAVLVGVVILGSCIGWIYRKFATRGYKSDSRWRQLEDDVTPFPLEKDNDDIYGGAAAPVIGSRRALADQTNRDDAYGSRPMSQYASNRAGLGSGRDAYSGAVPAQATYGVDVQGRPYNGQAGRVPAQLPYNDEYEYSHPPSPPTSRQLVGPGYSPPDLTPVPMGRPAAPRSYSDIAFREDYGDEPMSAGLPYEPMTARTNEWAGAPGAIAASQSRRISGRSSGSKSPSPPQPPMPLPTFAPLSPLDPSFAFQRNSQPLAMYENEPARQKQLYGEVAAFAGFPEPKTPHSAGLEYSAASNSTFNTGTTHSSFSATEHGVRLPVPPVPTINTKQPYEHGRPLSPLVEVSTPSTFNNYPLPSSSVGAGGHEYNPYDHLPAPRTLVAHHSAGSSGLGFPSAKLPPSSPGGMSLPASVTDSPKRWSGQGTPNVGMARRSRGESMFDDDDAYGGI